MFFLGVDPGIRKLGFAIINENNKILELGALINELKGDITDNARRISEIDDFFTKILKKYDIKSVCIEKLFFTKFNQANAEFVYGVRGLLLAKFYKEQMEIFSLTPKEIKKLTTGNGNSSKLMMQKTVKRLFNLAELPQPHDAADALAMALIAKKKYISKIGL